MPYPAGLMIVYEVSGFVNSVWNNEPECLETLGTKYS